jgi:beta-galactosidase
MRQTIKLNNNFTYCATDHPDYYAQQQDFSAIRIPHANIILPLNNFNEELYQFVSVYQTLLDLSEYLDQHLELIFEGNAGVSDIYLNGELQYTNKSWYNAFAVDLSNYCGEKVLVTVRLDSRENHDVPPFGKVIDYLTYGGIYRDVKLVITSKNYIKDVFVSSVKNKITVSSLVVSDQDYNLKIKIFDHDLLVYETVSSVTVVTDITWLGINHWSIDNPYLYRAVIELLVNEEAVDNIEIKFGVRDILFTSDGCFLNGERVKLVGLNRHQSYPYVGYAMVKRQQVSDAKMLKQLGCNVVRTAHYPQSHDFVSACDELGLLVITEIPGWQHLGNSHNWRNQVLTNVEDMVKQYRNHPSIILWGVRINESVDDHDLYLATNTLCRQLDSTRQTTGVRFIEKSELLEDVYAFNDFSHTGDNHGVKAVHRVLNDKSKPYLISEHNGHMNPTKSFDNELQRLSQALRHRKVINDAWLDHQISGVIGWAFADYNTHKDFGSGDRICYHGVLDINRMPKLAAAVYQAINYNETVMEIASSMNIGEYPGGFIGPIKVFTNCDAVKLYKNDVFISTFYQQNIKNQHVLPGLIVIDDMIGDQLINNEKFSPWVGKLVTAVMKDIAIYGPDHLPWPSKIKMAFLLVTRQLTFAQGYQLYGKYVSNWGEKNVLYRFEGFRKDQLVAVAYREPMKAWHLLVECDTAVLYDGDCYDVARLTIRCCDQHDNLLSYAQYPMTIATSKQLSIIGPSLRVLLGGQCAVYLRSENVGLGWVSIQCPDHPPVIVKIQVKEGNYD